MVVIKVFGAGSQPVQMSWDQWATQVLEPLLRGLKKVVRDSPIGPESREEPFVCLVRTQNEIMSQSPTIMFEVTGRFVCANLKWSETMENMVADLGQEIFPGRRIVVEIGKLEVVSQCVRKPAHDVAPALTT